MATNSGTPQPADRWHVHLEEESAFGTLNGSPFASAYAYRTESGSTYTAEYEEIQDTTLKEDDGDDESGRGVPIVGLKTTTQLEGLGTAAGHDDSAPASTALSKLLSCSFNVAERRPVGSLCDGSPSTTVVQQEAETTEFEAGDHALFTTANYGLVARRIASVDGSKNMTLSMALPEAPAGGSEIYGSNSIYLAKSHAGAISPTLQAHIKDPLQAASFDLYGLGCRGFEIGAAARNAQKMATFDMVGTQFLRGPSRSLTQAAGSIPRTSVNRQAWIGVSGSAAAATRLSVFDWTFKSGHNTHEIPNEDPTFANAGYHYQMAFDFMMTLYYDSEPPGASGTWREVWEDANENTFQIFVQHGTAGGRIFNFDLQYLILKKPTGPRSQSTIGGPVWVIDLPFKVLTAITGDFGTMSMM